MCSKMGPRPVFLDVDSSIVEKNLRITEDPSDEDFKTLFAPGEQYASKVVKPFPGFCVKSKEVGTESKIFVNICHTDAIPAPVNITEEQLVEICSSNSDELLEFRIPMSIGDVRSESDKKGNEAKAVDVAIHPQFFDKVEKSSLFRNFLMSVVFEGLGNKHQLYATDERILLKNRKAYGNLQMHRIQQRDVEQKMGKVKEKDGQVLHQLRGNVDGAQAKPKIETLSSVTYDQGEDKTPEYRLFKTVGAPKLLIGEFKLPNVLDCKELTLDVGEDRIILESKGKGHFVDLFVPCSIIQESVQSKFNKSSKILTITMPIKIA